MTQSDNACHMETILYYTTSISEQYIELMNQVMCNLSQS